MRPETTNEKLNRLLRRQQRLTMAAWVIGTVAVVGAISVFLVDPEPVGTFKGTLERFQQRPSDDEIPVRLVVVLDDGREVIARPRPGDAALQPGADLCFMRTRNPIIGYVRHVRLPLSRCDES